MDDAQVLVSPGHFRASKALETVWNRVKSIQEHARSTISCDFKMISRFFGGRGLSPKQNTSNSSTWGVEVSEGLRARAAQRHGGAVPGDRRGAPGEGEGAAQGPGRGPLQGRDHLRRLRGGTEGGHLRVPWSETRDGGPFGRRKRQEMAGWTGISWV